MSGQWKPGELIADDDGGQFYIVAVSANTRSAWGPGVSAVDADGNGWRVGTIENAHRLIVIDPQDGLAAVKMGQAIGSLIAAPGEDISRIIAAVQAELRKMADPPKPVEPQLVASVVVDSNNHIWSRTAWNTWRCMSDSNVEPETWDRLNIGPDGVRSEGVPQS